MTTIHELMAVMSDKTIDQTWEDITNECQLILDEFSNDPHNDKLLDSYRWHYDLKLQLAMESVERFRISMPDAKEDARETDISAMYNDIITKEDTKE